ncbi:transcriptional regulator TACO1-like protein [Xylaria bambusicola]|uniref:transcriptional regulator TACO1-like protein n=1 Tax=Xylaria bambusicola TaxID=326684 RepID=UPI002008283D|nr:transcriptional regulator TACO1-like protein [Xylaria bambusicola]KAI0506788.1 transcriptional regulator TACO1-like protein [Xylaria bambusicola]
MSSLLSISPFSSRIALPSRSPIIRSTKTICAQCRRSFAANAILASGHSKWSKIKHDKAAADQKKNTQRSGFAKQLTVLSKMYGPDPNMNPQLASIISQAKKVGMPKAGIDIAIARGQGKTETGAGLETATLEVMMAPVAMVIDIESDNKQRSLKDLRPMVKKLGATVTPTAFLFTRQGRAVLGRGDDDPDGANPAIKMEREKADFDDLMMQALEAGAEDVEADGEGNVVLWTQPNMTQKVAQDFARTSGLRILSSDIIWSCASDKARVDDPEAATTLAKLLAAIREYPDVQAVYTNAERGDVSEEVWSAVEEALDS